MDFGFRIFLGVVALLLPASHNLEAAEGWQSLKSQHFIVRYEGEARFAESVSRLAEQEYDRITRDLGFTRHDSFWTWENRVQIDVYATRVAYRAATGAPAWSAGRADYVGRRIATCAGSQAFLDSLLPHELTHLIFREFVGTGRDIPLWLDEGVAQWEDRSNRVRVDAIARQLKAEKRLQTIPGLMATSIRHAASGKEAIEFYAQSASLVGFMITGYGSRRFREFCGHLRDGHGMEDALRFTYPQTIHNLAALGGAWSAHLEEPAG